MLLQIACCKTAGRLSMCANSIVIQVYLCLGPLQCALKNVLACRTYNIVSSSSSIWFYSLVRTVTARTVLASIWGTSTVTYLLTYLLTPWSRVLLEKLTGSAASQEILRIFGTRRFITVLTSASHLSLS